MDLDDLRHAASLGAPGAWDALGRALSEELRRFFAKHFDTATADDLAQTTVSIILAKLDDFEPRGPHSFRNWVFAIAGNQGRKRRFAPIHEAARRAKLVAKPSSTAPTTPSARMLRQQRLEIIARALPELSERHRRTLLSELAGEDYSSIAAREGITVSSVRVRLHRTIRRLQELVAASRATPATPA